MGNLNVYKAGLRYMLDSDNYPASEECEYAYVVNLDTKKVEITSDSPEEERRRGSPTGGGTRRRTTTGTVGRCPWSWRFPSRM